MPRGNPSTEAIRRPKTEVIAEYIDDGARHVHIAGEPGIGKTTTLHQVTTEFQGEYDVAIRNIRPNHSLTDIFREINHAVFDHLPDHLTENGRSLTGISGRTNLFHC